MMITQHITDDDDGNDNGNDVLDLSVKKSLPVLLSPPSSTTSSSSSSSILPTVGKRMLDSNLTSKTQSTNKRPLRFQCKYCDYKAPSTSLMQNHIYRHTDLTPYACAYCGHKSTTKSTIMVHIELCHPNMEVKIIENRVREQDFYRDLNSSDLNTQEPQLKKVRRANQSDIDFAPINGVAVPMKILTDDGHEFSPENEEISENERFEPIVIPSADEENEKSVQELSSPIKIKISPPSTPTVGSSPNTITKESDDEDDSEYLLVYNRPKQYYGSLYEPDKQYACRICSYTTNHRPSMEDHVYVHTNEKPYKCGYCGEEIFTRYAATYHIKYKHTGMPRNFIQNKADVTQYYVNRAKKDEEKNQFKIVDTRRVKVRTRTEKITNNSSQESKAEISTERKTQTEPSPPLTTSKSNDLPTATATNPDYRFLLAWSYYLATQTAWLSPMLQQQGSSFPTDPEGAAKFLQAMQTVMNPLSADLTNKTKSKEQIENE